MITIAIGIGAFLALRAYNAAEVANPVGTHSTVVRVLQGAEMVRVVAAFITSVLFVLRGNFRPSGQAPLRARLSFGSQLASDED